MALVQSSRSPEEQLKLLHQEGNRCHFPNFDMKVKEMNALPLIAGAVEILQINLGKMCNQTCHHCHVDAGPHRKEIMSKEVLEQCLKILSKNEIATVDLTGGAPEMNPHFRWFVEEASALGVKVMVRCNLTIILAHEKYRELPEFYRDHNVEVISSLPHYTKLRTDRQRGHGVFERSIEALQMLNTVGYGKQRTDLKLNLVYNPGGAFFPGDQAGLEREFKRKLLADFGIEFNHLYCITNMPISRFLDYLLASGNFEDYMSNLVKAFNPVAAKGVMCLNTLSVDWQGNFYDCDFNQMLEIPINRADAATVFDFDVSKLVGRRIRTDFHCYGCTAGSGSSCGGSLDG